MDWYGLSTLLILQRRTGFTQTHNRTNATGDKGKTYLHYFTNPSDLSTRWFSCSLFLSINQSDLLSCSKSELTSETFSKLGTSSRMADWPQAWFLLKHDERIANETSNCTYNVTLRHAGVTIVAVGKPISIIYSLCVSVALVIQHVMRMCRIILYGPSGCTILFRHDLREDKFIDHNMCVLIFTTFVRKLFAIYEEFIETLS